MAILLQWCQSMALSKTHNPQHLFAWPVAKLEENNIVKMVALMAPSNLRQDSMTPTKSQRKLYIVLINLAVCSNLPRYYVV